jgi:hypothetical protein
MDEEIFFKDAFKELLDNSKSFVIQYHHKDYTYKGEEYMTIIVDGVNEKKSIWQFKSEINKFIKQGLQNLTEVLEGSSLEDKLNLLEYFREEFDNLKSYVTTEEIEYPEFEGEPAGKYTRYKFVSYTISGTKDDKPYYNDSILQKAQDYPKAWLEVIVEGKAKIDFLINQIELLPQSKDLVRDPNTIKIFFSWQSDNDTERKHIRKSLSKIVKVFKAESKTLIIDSDMRDVPGSQDIPNTLFNKIEACDIFIADLNLVFKSAFRDSVHSPNPNVLIELGYAGAKKGWKNIIMLYNVDNQRIEELPFDIRQRSILWYNTENIDELDKKIIYAIKKILQ